MSPDAPARPSWERGWLSLRERMARIPQALRDAAGAPLPDVSGPVSGMRRLVATGLGSSTAHARLLVHLLAEAGVPARFVPTGALLRPPDDAGDDVLAVFSQGLSPNARFALAAPERWRATLVVTAVGEQRPPSAAKAVLLERPGVLRVPVLAPEEYATLVRVIGPAVVLLRTFALARAVAAARPDAAEVPAADVDTICAALDDAPARADAALAGADTRVFDAPTAFLAGGGYGELAHNLRLKLLEGMLRPLPPVFDLLEFAHGPFQQASTGAATFVTLERAEAPEEAALFERAAAMLGPAQRLLRLPARLPGALALFEHELMLDAWVAHRVSERRLDLRRWPAYDRDRPLYRLSAPEQLDAPIPEVPPAPTAPAPDAAESRLAHLHWPDVRDRLRAGTTWAVLPLGATEQHGPHLPLATDTWIADALAERLCARAPEALRLPALPYGCSSEHAAFPGTVSMDADALRAVLLDAVRSLSGAGFAGVFLFSAHGGNHALLRDALPALREAAAPAHVAAFADGGAVAQALRAVAAEHGVDAAVAGHHAGELETSILLALRPEAVRGDRLAAGILAPQLDAQDLFYPSVRERAPDGVVGDPRPADPARAAAYLDTWTDVLLAAYRREKNASHTNGTLKA